MHVSSGADQELYDGAVLQRIIQHRSRAQHRDVQNSSPYDERRRNVKVRRRSDALENRQSGGMKSSSLARGGEGTRLAFSAEVRDIRSLFAADFLPNISIFKLISGDKMLNW